MPKTMQTAEAGTYHVGWQPHLQNRRGSTLDWGKVRTERTNRGRKEGGRETWLAGHDCTKFRTLPGTASDLTPLSDSRASPRKDFTSALEESSCFLWMRTRTRVWTPVAIVKWLGEEEEIDCEDKLSL